MASVFAWLDQSEEQRRKVLDVIDLFREQGTVDELGLGTIRDAFADLLFPGTSNLMTRAAYYLFVPWMYLRLERQKTPSSEMSAKGRREELKLIERLLENGESEGVIGRRARKDLRRLPSGLYWAGMKRLGICLVDGTPDSYHRSMDRFYRGHRAGVTTDDGERINPVRANWNPRLPAASDDWPTKTNLNLTKAQAEFLRDQIALSAPTSMFAVLVRAPQAPTDVEFPWAHPEFARLSDQTKWQLGHAQNISETMHGAALLYNLILAELTRNDELLQGYEESLGGWAAKLSQRLSSLKSWDRTDAWKCAESEGARIPRPTRDFVDTWCDLSLNHDPAKIAKDRRARVLITQRERRLKGPLARIENKRAQELWRGASSTRRLQFRWSNAAVIVQDIVDGIHGRPNA